MKVKKVIRRILAGTVVASLFFTSAVMAGDLETSAAKTKESSQSCSNSLDLSDTNEKWPGIGPITNPKYGEGGWSYVYYGSKIYGGVRYRVLDKAATQFSTKKTILLDSDVVFSERPYRLSTDPYEWDGSDLRSFLNGTTYGNFYFEFFTDNERNAIVPSYKSAPDPDDGTFSGAFTKLTGEKIFLLDGKEVSRPSYGYEDTQYSHTRKKKDAGGDDAEWWLRTTDILPDDGEGIGPQIVYNRIDSLGYYDYFIRSMEPSQIAYAGTNKEGYCPAFNLDLSSILFTELVYGNAGEEGAEYKLTIKDDKIQIAQGADSVTRSGNTITIPYAVSGDRKASAKRISVLITDEEYVPGKEFTSGFVYKVLTDDADINGSESFVLPDAYANRKCGRDYHAYIFAEWMQEEKMTDYASAPAEIMIPDKEYNIKCSVEGKGSAKADKNIAVAGDTIAITATPDKGWIFAGWKALSGNITFADKNSASTTFVMGTEDANITAVFKMGEIKLNTTKLVVQKGKTNKSVMIAFTNDSLGRVESTNKSIAKVTAKGNKLYVKGIKKGKIVVTITSKGGLTEKLNITVQKGKVTTKSIKLSKSKITIKKKKIAKITVKAIPDRISTNEKISIKNSDKKIASASVDQKTGTVNIKGKKKGKCVITVKVGKKRKKLKVTVK